MTPAEALKKNCKPKLNGTSCTNLHSVQILKCDVIGLSGSSYQWLLKPRDWPKLSKHDDITSCPVAVCRMCSPGDCFALGNPFFFPSMFVPKSHPQRLEWYDQVCVAETDFPVTLLASQVLYVMQCLVSVCLLAGRLVTAYTVCDCFYHTCFSVSVLFLNYWRVWFDPGGIRPPEKQTDAMLMVMSRDSSIKWANQRRQGDLCFGPLCPCWKKFLRRAL